MAKFKVGDRVRVVSDGAHGYTKGWEGKVAVHRGVGCVYPNIVEFDSEIENKEYRYAGIANMRHYADNELELVSHEPNAGNVESVLKQCVNKMQYNDVCIYKSNKPKSIMNKINSFVRSIIDADTQALIEAGFISECLEITQEGKAELTALVFAEKKAELVKLAKAKVADAKKVK